MFTSRKEAIAAGVVYYLTGRPCKHGHISKRHVTAGCYACLLTAQAKHRNENKEAWSAKNYRWRNENRDRIKEKDAEYRETHREERKVYRLSRKVRVRQASKTQLNELDMLVVKECQDLAKIRSEETGIPWHVDHMLPLNGVKVSGLHCAHNLQVIPASLNLYKNNKMIMTEHLDWLRYSVSI